MTTSARLVDEITNEVIWLSHDEADPEWCDDEIRTDTIDYGFASPRVNQNNLPDVNGTSDLTKFHAEKTVSWNGWVVPTDANPFPALTWDRVRRLCAPNRRPFLFVSEDGWDSERRMVLRCDNVTSPLDRSLGPVIIAAIVWKCASGVMESSLKHSQKILISGGSGGQCITSTGYCFTQSGCNNFSAGDFGGATIIVNAGTVVTYPIITFTGPSKNPRVINLLNNYGIYLNATLAANQQIVVDTLHRTVTEIAQPPINRLSMYDFTRSTWLTLEAGQNEFTYFSDDKRGTCTFDWRDRWT